MQQQLVLRRWQVQVSLQHLQLEAPTVPQQHQLQVILAYPQQQQQQQAGTAQVVLPEQWCHPQRDQKQLMVALPRI
jgi:hypothetical protein